MNKGQKREALYRAIHDSIVDLRIKLKLPGPQDVDLAQLEHKIWQKQRAILYPSD